MWDNHLLKSEDSGGFKTYRGLGWTLNRGEKVGKPHLWEPYTVVDFIAFINRKLMHPAMDSNVTAQQS